MLSKVSEADRLLIKENPKRSAGGEETGQGENKQNEREGPEEPSTNGGKLGDQRPGACIVSGSLGKGGVRRKNLKGEHIHA